MSFQDKWEAPKVTIMTIQEEVDRALSVLLPSDLKSILRQMAMRYPHGFLAIVRGQNVPEDNTKPQRIYRTPEEFKQNPDLLRQCIESANEFLNQKKIISAIKSVREISGLGLKESKEFVENLPAFAAHKNSWNNGL